MPRDARINLYHLRMATPERRRLRRALYAAADPERLFQPIGYDYLADERGMVLEPIPESRGFSPPFEEDQGLWAPDPGELAPPVPDAMEPRLAFAAASAAAGGAAAACHALTDLAAASPGDEDLPLAAGAMALAAGMLAEAGAVAGAALAARPDDLFALELRARARLGAGKTEAAREDAARLVALAPESPVARALAAEVGRATDDFTRADAHWRRWAPGAARCREGAGVARADLAVVVIGLGAPGELAEAVASIVAQDAAAEIVVVNSGGGDPEGVLAEHLDKVRLIAVEDRLFAGAARNIGIDASRARYVAFLASDCRALPGWVSGRLARHRAGALSVSTPVVPEGRAGLLPVAANRLRYWARSPGADPAFLAHFGRSYDRRLFHAAGYFPPGLRVAEDDALNRRVDRIAAPVWAPEVLTTHRDPEGLLGFLADARARGRRRADHPPFRAMAGRPGAAADLGAEMRRLLRAGWKALDRDGGLSPRRRALARAAQWLAIQADRRGVAAALKRLARADRALARAEALAGKNAGGAVSAARAAARLDPQDWRKAHRLELCLSGAEPSEAAAGFRRALALAPQVAGPLEALVGLLQRQGAGGEALAEAERAALAAPASRRHWEIAAQAALGAGQPALALAHARRALAAAPDAPSAHACVAAAHRAAEAPVPALFRDHCRARLEQAAARRKAR
ncbi:MAG: glycosyltransferase, partial [Paracoccaceae bacterium]|nr:glycosyltransferase [Paracoccaceae bacterium]